MKSWVKEWKHYMLHWKGWVVWLSFSSDGDFEFGFNTPWTLCIQGYSHSSLSEFAVQVEKYFVSCKNEQWTKGTYW